MNNKTVTHAELNDAQEIIDAICEGVNAILKEARESFETKSVSEAEFYEQLKKIFDKNYLVLRKQHEANNDLVSLFGLNVVQTMLLDNVRNKDLHKVKEYVGEINAQGKVNLYSKFN